MRGVLTGRTFGVKAQLTRYGDYHIPHLWRRRHRIRGVQLCNIYRYTDLHIGMNCYVVCCIALILLECVCHCSALPGGAPTGACNTFTPRHADRDNPGSFISPQSRDSSPYVVRMSRMNFTADTVIRGKYTATS